MKISLGSKGFATLLLPIIVLTLAFLGRKWYFTPNASTGDKAVNFTAETINGNRFSLSDTQGQITLLHFWGSWCGPCRRQNPELVVLAKELGAQLRIVSIGIELKKANWLAAIQRDGLFWPDQIIDQSTNLKFLDGGISDLYGVNEVPTKLLLDKKGTVVATNPSIAEIRQYVSDER